MDKLFNERESYMIIESLRNERERSIKILDEMEKEGKRPLFTKGFIEREVNELIDKVEKHTQE